MIVEHGHTVKVHYTGTLSDGEVFDTSKGREPLEFEVGVGQVIPGFENGVLGLAVGQSKTVVIPPSEAYGEWSEELIHMMPKSEVPDEMELFLGQELELSDEEGNVVPVLVVDLTDEHVVLDGNHALAGQELTFEIELLEIVAE
jgi:peptidylprolyl isomerase